MIVLGKMDTAPASDFFKGNEVTHRCKGDEDGTVIEVTQTITPRNEFFDTYWRITGLVSWFYRFDSAYPLSKIHGFYIADYKSKSGSYYTFCPLKMSYLIAGSGLYAGYRAHVSA